MKMNFEQRVKIVAYLNNKTIKDLAKEFNISLSSFTSRCKTGKMNFADQRTIAEILGCTIVIKFVFDDGVEYTGKTAKELITDACAHVGMTQTELSERLGKSRQTVSSKLIKGKFTDAEIEEIASKIGCTYYNYFELVDGSRI